MKEKCLQLFFLFNFFFVLFLYYSGSFQLMFSHLLTPWFLFKVMGITNRKRGLMFCMRFDVWRQDCLYTSTTGVQVHNRLLQKTVWTWIDAEMKGGWRSWKASALADQTRFELSLGQKWQFDYRWKEINIKESQKTLVASAPLTQIWSLQVLTALTMCFRKKRLMKL